VEYGSHRDRIAEEGDPFFDDFRRFGNMPIESQQRDLVMVSYLCDCLLQLYDPLPVSPSRHDSRDHEEDSLSLTNHLDIAISTTTRSLLYRDAGR
jgi:hypothetical protein